MSLTDPPTPDERRRAVDHLHAIKASGARRRRRRRYTLAGVPALAALVVAITFISLAATPSGQRTGVHVISPSPSPSPSTATVTGSPHGHCPRSSPSVTTATVNPTNPGLAVRAEPGGLYDPVTAIAAGPSTIFIAGQAVGCSRRSLSGLPGLDRVTADGRHLTRVPLPLDVTDLTTIGFAGPSRGWAVGQTLHHFSDDSAADEPDVAWVTDDGAASWHRVRLPAGSGVVGITAGSQAT
jgi:hypothetical protein